MQTTVFRIGTRGSALALAQAHETRARLMAAHALPEEAFAIVVISTSGDRIQDRPLSEAGGKGLFTKEIEEALLDGRIDIAVHSSKDMPTALPDGLELAAFLPREDPRDAFIGGKAARLRDLPDGAVVGSSSLRRQALIRRLRPDLQVVMFRGNVQTRLRKLDEGAVDGTLLANAGLRRLGLDGRITELLSLEDFPPAPGQGAICIEARQGDEAAARLLVPIGDAATAAALTCERAFLGVARRLLPHADRRPRPRRWRQDLIRGDDHHARRARGARDFRRRAGGRGRGDRPSRRRGGPRQGRDALLRGLVLRCAVAFS